MACEAVDNVCYKVIVLGDSGVGKTALILRYVFRTFNPDIVSTVGVEFLLKKVKYKGEGLKLRIWDTVGQERFAPLNYSYFRDADVAIYCYDITRQHSFLNIRKWLHEFPLPSDCFLVLVGCKSDFAHERVISTEEGQSMADSLRVKFFETSAVLENSNVDDIFDFIISRLAGKKPNCVKKEDTTVELTSSDSKRKSCKC